MRKGIRYCCEGALKRAKPGVWWCIQVREVSSSEEETNMWSGHFWISAPVTMLVNSSELCATDFPLTEVRPLQLDVVARGGRRTRVATVRKLQGVGNSTFVLSVENDNDFRSRCE